MLVYCSNILISLVTNNLDNNWPEYHLLFLYNILEEVVFQQYYGHMNDDNLFFITKSAAACHPHHITESLHVIISSNMSSAHDKTCLFISTTWFFYCIWYNSSRYCFIYRILHMEFPTLLLRFLIIFDRQNTIKCHW